MKLLFDENLSPKLPKLLADIFPEGEHVRNVGLKRSSMSLLYGPPPKVIGIFSGNCPTSEIVELLQASHHTIEKFLLEDEAAFLQLIR